MIFHVLRPCTMFVQSAYRLHICWYATCFKPIINNWQLILISCSTFKKKAPNGHHGRQDRCEAQQACLEQWYPECAEARPRQDRTQEEWWGRRQGRALLSGHRCWDPPERPRRRLQEVAPGEGSSIQGYADVGRDGIEQRPKPLKDRVADDPSLSLYMERRMCAAWSFTSGFCYIGTNLRPEHTETRWSPVHCLHESISVASYVISHPNIISQNFKYLSILNLSSNNCKLCQIWEANSQSQKK